MTTNTSWLSNVYCACWSDCTSCWLALPVTVGGPKRLHITGATHGLQPQTHTPARLKRGYAATHNIHNTQRCSFLSEIHGITNPMPTYLRDFTPASTLSTFTTLLKTYHHPALRVRITGFVLQFLALEYGTYKLSRNVGGNYHYLLRNSSEECSSLRRTCLYTDWPVRVLTKSKILWA